jgi:hypothetical protein
LTKGHGQAQNESTSRADKEIHGRATFPAEEQNLSRNEAIEQARADAARRTHVDPSEVKEISVEDADFPDMVLGAPEKGELGGMMISSGWRIKLQAGGKKLEYRADKYHVRLYNFEGRNYKL